MLFKKIFAASGNEIHEVLKLNAKPVKTGSGTLDKFLAGGFPICAVGQIFGPSGSGKTNICLCTSAEVAKLGKKVLYIDTENGFNAERFKQISSENLKKISENVMLKNLSSFKEQREFIRNLKNVLNEKFGFVVFDSFVSLYRLESSGSRERMIELSKELGRQLSILSELARKFNLAVLITNQVYEPFSENKKKGISVEAVGGDPLVYWSKVIVELEKDSKPSFRIARLVKHPLAAEGRTLKFRITERGIE